MARRSGVALTLLTVPTSTPWKRTGVRPATKPGAVWKLTTTVSPRACRAL